MLLHDHVDWWAERQPDGEFALHHGARTTWTHARDASVRAARALLRAGLAPGECCAVLTRTPDDHVLLEVAASRADVHLLLLDPQGAVALWDRAVLDAHAMLLVCGPGFDGVALPAMPVVDLDELYAPASAARPRITARAPVVAPCAVPDPARPALQGG